MWAKWRRWVPMLAAAVLVAWSGPARGQYPGQHYYVPPPPPRGLGVYTTVVNVNPYGIPNPADPQGLPVYGLRVESLVPNGPAQRAGVEPGDVILLANGARVRSIADLRLYTSRWSGPLPLGIVDVRTGNLVTVYPHLGPSGYPPVVVAPSYASPPVVAAPAPPG